MLIPVSAKTCFLLYGSEMQYPHYPKRLLHALFLVCPDIL